MYLWPLQMARAASALATAGSFEDHSATARVCEVGLMLWKSERTMYMLASGSW